MAEEKRSETVRDIGLVVGKVSPCHFLNKEWGVCNSAHGDDFALVGAKDYLAKIVKHMNG